MSLGDISLTLGFEELATGLCSLLTAWRVDGGLNSSHFANPSSLLE